MNPTRNFDIYFKSGNSAEFYVDVLDVSMTSGLYPTDVHCAWQFFPNSGMVSTYAPELHENTRHTVPYLYPEGKVKQQKWYNNNKTETKKNVASHCLKFKLRTMNKFPDDCLPKKV